MRSARLATAGLLAALATLVPALTTGTAAGGARAASGGGADVVSRDVAFSLVNANSTADACSSDGRTYRVRGQLVGPRREVLGANADRVDVLVHGLGTGSWLWHLREQPAYDYAAGLARAGETSLVLDRLGYGASPIPGGNDTCLGAQADMLHQVVQHLHSGLYRFAGSGQAVPSVHHVVLQGHAAGAAIAQLEAATYDDVDGLVLMSWTDGPATRPAADAARQQSRRCLGDRDFARYAGSDRDYRALLFRTAPAGVQRVAADRRGPAPCGDVLSLAPTIATGRTSARDVEAPVLLVFGSRDRLNRADTERQQEQSYSSSVRVRRTTVSGAGNALPLERSAATTRARVLRWLATVA